MLPSTAQSTNVLTRRMVNNMNSPSPTDAPLHPHGLLPEPALRRLLAAALAWCVTIAFALCAFIYWTPSHGGVDQNGYLVGGKLFSETLSMRQTPTQIDDPTRFDPHGFVANMWVTAADNPQHFYPKYPLGLPLVYAIAFWLGDGIDAVTGNSQTGIALAHAISPVAMSLAVLGVFFLARQFAGSFGGVLAMLVFATSPSTGNLVINPNSHAATVCCVVWGMICVLHWWQTTRESGTSGARWAVAGGVLVGYAATIRYSEAALVLPLLWAAVCSLRYRRRAWMEAILLLISWATPIVLLLAYNKLEMGTFTGYDATNESRGFAWAYFANNWETILRQIGTNGLFLLFPIGIVGLVMMPTWNWRMAIFVSLWALPCVLIYTFYYWAPDGLGYLRFVLTSMPPLLVAAVWVMAHARPGTTLKHTPRYVIVLIATFSGLMGMVGGFYLLRLDMLQMKIADDGIRSWFVSVEQYLWPAEQTRLVGETAAVVFAAMLGMFGAWGAAVGVSIIKRRVAMVTLAGGVVAFLSIAVQADNTLAQLERESITRRVMLASVDTVRRLVPEGAVLICREENILHHWQLIRSDRVYTGLTFDRNWVNNRPAGPVADEPVLIDPQRIDQLKQTLGKLEQSQLNEAARTFAKNAIAANRRVFILESSRLDELQRARREKKPGPVPEFIRRYINSAKDTGLSAERSVYWNVPLPFTPEKPDASARQRGRRDGRDMGKSACYSLWEITAIKK